MAFELKEVRESPTWTSRRRAFWQRERQVKRRQGGRMAGRFEELKEARNTKLYYPIWQPQATSHMWFLSPEMCLVQIV